MLAVRHLPAIEWLGANLMLCVVCIVCARYAPSKRRVYLYIASVVFAIIAVMIPQRTVERVYREATGWLGCRRVRWGQTQHNMASFRMALRDPATLVMLGPDPAYELLAGTR